MSISFYAAAVSLAAVWASAPFGMAVALAGAPSVTVLQPRSEEPTRRFALAACPPAVACFILWPSSAAVAIALVAALALALLRNHDTVRRIKLQEQNARLQASLESANALVDHQVRAARSEWRSDFRSFLHEIRNAHSATRLNLMYLRSEGVLHGEAAKALEGAWEGQGLAEDLVAREAKKTYEEANDATPAVELHGPRSRP